jgi:hypothetical protein
MAVDTLAQHAFPGLGTCTCICIRSLLTLVRTLLQGRLTLLPSKNKIYLGLGLGTCAYICIRSLLVFCAYKRDLLTWRKRYRGGWHSCPASLHRLRTHAGCAEAHERLFARAPCGRASAHCQEWYPHTSKRDLLYMQKRPTIYAKETY